MSRAVHVGSVLCEEGSRYLLVSERTGKNKFTVCEYYAEPNGRDGARVFAIGEHSFDVTGEYLGKLKPASSRLRNEIVDRYCYSVAWHERFAELSTRKPALPMDRIYELCKKAARSAVAASAKSGIAKI